MRRVCRILQFLKRVSCLRNYLIVFILIVNNNLIPVAVDTVGQNVIVRDKGATAYTPPEISVKIPAWKGSSPGLATLPPIIRLVKAAGESVNQNTSLQFQHT